MKIIKFFGITFFILMFTCSGQGWSFPKSEKKIEKDNYDQSLYKAMKWRCIGPYRGGRVTAVAGIPSRPYTYYFGATGGGVWKTEDGGLSWSPVSDSCSSNNLNQGNGRGFPRESRLKIPYPPNSGIKTVFLSRGLSI